MTRAEYDQMVADTRAAPGWKPRGEPDCSDCCTMSHCESHHKVEGEYPFDSEPTEPRPLGPPVLAGPLLKAACPQRVVSPIVETPFMRLLKREPL